jgi:cytochrome c biogenesis protein
VTTRYQGVEEQGEIKVNSPIAIAGTETYLLGNGYAPQVTVRDPDGTVVFTNSVPFLPQDANLTSLGVIKIPDGLAEQLGMIGFFYPTVATNDAGAKYSSFPDLSDPLLTLEVYQGDLGIDDGVPRSVYELATADLTQIAGRQSEEPTIELAIGDTVELPNGLGSISLEAVPRYASLEVHRDPAQGFVFVFALLAITGLIVSLFVPRRRLWVKAVPGTDGTVTLEYAGLARGEDPGLEQAIGDLIERHGRALRLDQ